MDDNIVAKIGAVFYILVSVVALAFMVGYIVMKVFQFVF